MLEEQDYRTVSILMQVKYVATNKQNQLQNAMLDRQLMQSKPP